MNHIKLNHLSQGVLFITDLEKIIGRNRLTLRRWWTAGKFPVPIKLNGNTLVWHMETINYWMSRISNLVTIECELHYSTHELQVFWYMGTYLAIAAVAYIFCDVSYFLQ